ncbi:hypothetical protein [Ignicoccus islandicus]|uniref:hypothetical protein n=1 Tax=Ignicoccus islandicus TaxID=54259 RepID=UPI0012EEA5B9|nr:hypothetical protein [Ignicoccus islandicus]
MRAEEPNKLVLLLIKETVEELLDMAEPDEKHVIMELASLIDEKGIKPSNSFEKRTVEALRESMEMRRRVAEKLYPILKDLIRSVYEELSTRDSSASQQ